MSMDAPGTANSASDLVVAGDPMQPALNRLLEDHQKYPEIRYGIKLGDKNIGWNGRFYTFPYFLTFLRKKWLRERILAGA